MTSAVLAPKTPRVTILNVPVDRVNMTDALTKIEEFVKDGRPHMVVTADSSGIAQAQSDPEFMKILNEADLVTPDSVGVLWAARRKGGPIQDRVSGVDLVDKICGLSADKGYRIFLLGSEPGVADLAAEKLRLLHPGCNIVGSRHGYFPADSDEIVAQEVAAAKPQILFVAMGIPRQEKFIAKTKHIIGASVAMGVGGSLDVFSGKTKRAPKLFQKLKMEWLWRLILNPSKIQKAKSLPRFVSLVLKETR